MALIRQTMLAMASAILVTGSRFLFMAILSRRLALAEFGHLAYVQWLVDLSILLCSFGVNSVAGRYFAEHRGRPDLLAQVMRRWRPLALGVPVLAALITGLAGAWVAPERASTEIAAMACWSFSNGLWVMQSAALTGFQRFDRILWANGVSAVILLAGAAAIPASASLAAMFALCALANAAAAGLSMLWTPGPMPASDASAEAPDWRSVRRYAVNMWLTTLLWSLVWSRGEWPFVKATVGDVGIAHYAAVTTIFGGAVQAMMLAVAGMAPELTRLWGKGQLQEALALSRRAMDVQLLLGACFTVGLILFGPWLLRLAFGARYAGGAEALAWIAVGLPALAWACHNHLLQLATDARYTRDATLAGLIALLALAAVLVPRFGIEGGAVSRAATMCFMSLLSLGMVAWRWGRSTLPWSNFAVVGCATAGALAAARLLEESSLVPRFGIFCALAALLVFGIREGDAAAACVWWRRLRGARPAVKSEQCA